MNDYLGGVVVALAHDASGRPVRQAERNIYLPQPNYLVLYQGKPIDVSKLEVVEYAADRHRLYWKTVLSENDSATYDDGIATFERTGDGTRVTITGRQQFTLPMFWQVFDPDIVPGLKARLVTHAYQTFFDRTIANFEALVEGRDIRIGRPVDEPAPPPVEQLMPLLQQIGEIAMPLLRQLAGRNDGTMAGADHRIDSDGFVHITPAQSAASDAGAMDRRDHTILRRSRPGRTTRSDTRSPGRMRVLVTGAAGLIGAHIVRALVGAGHEVRAWCDRASRRDSLDGLPVTWIVADLLHADRISTPHAPTATWCSTPRRISPTALPVRQYCTAPP